MKKILTITIMLIALYLISFSLSNILTNNFKQPSNKIAVIQITGTITSTQRDYFLTQDTTSSTKIIELIEKANKDSSVKAIIFEINSPGGTVVATSEIVNAIKKIEKPTTALIRDVGASGAYWIASSTDLIIAHPMSVTGSIGVISSYLEFSDLMEKYGVTYVSLKTGEFKDTGSPYKKLTQQERISLQSKLDIIHDYFVAEVAANRGLSKQQVNEIANGLFYLGIEAKEINLVDELGDMDLAIELTKKLANIEKAKITKFKEEEKLLDILSKLSSSSSFLIGRGIGSQFYTDLNTKRDISIIT